MHLHVRMAGWRQRLEQHTSCVTEELEEEDGIHTIEREACSRESDLLHKLYSSILIAGSTCWPPMRHGHSHHRSTFLRRRCCPPTCQRHRHLPQLRQRAQRTAWTSLCPLQELVTRKIDVLLNFDGKQNPADALTKHIEPKATFLDYMARLYNATASLFPLPLQPHHLYGTPS